MQWKFQSPEAPASGSEREQQECCRFVELLPADLTRATIF